MVDAQRPDPGDGRGVRLIRAAQQRADPPAQLRVGERLCDDVVAAAVEHPHPLELARAGGEHDHRRVRVDLAGESFAAADRVEQPERLAVDVGEHQLRVVA